MVNSIIINNNAYIVSHVINNRNNKVCSSGPVQQVKKGNKLIGRGGRFLTNNAELTQKQIQITQQIQFY